MEEKSYAYYARLFTDILDEARVEQEQAVVSDLILAPDQPPFVKVGGVYQRLGLPALSRSDLLGILMVVLPEWLYKNVEGALKNNRLPEDVQVSYATSSARYRVQISWVRSEDFATSLETAAPVIVMRFIPRRIWRVQDLGLPPILLELTEYTSGLILVTGPTDSGKTTTLATMVDNINSKAGRHIQIIERPVEYVHTPKNSVVVQREVGRHVKSVKDAIFTALRQNVDVIVVGEVRTPEEYEAILMAAETGHLVLASMHAPGAVEAIERILLASMGFHRIAPQVLANTLLGVIAQRLIPSGKPWRVLAYELLMVDSKIASFIKEGALDKVYEAMSNRVNGSKTLEQSLAELVRQKKIPQEVVRYYANREERLLEELRR